MKKTLLLVAIVVTLVALTAAPAMAGGWWQISDDGYGGGPASGSPYASDSGNGFTWDADSLGIDTYTDMLGARPNSLKADDWGTTAGYWSGDNPHGGFATTTNYCKTCHAVHDSGASSYRLLKNGDTLKTRASGEGTVAGMGSARANECMYCHNATSGATGFRPYALGIVNTVRGEHTIGATRIPDSSLTVDAAGIAPVSPRANGDGSSKLSNRDPSGEGAKFGCYDCHSVHGADTMIWPAGMILRDDPSNDGIKTTDARTGFAPDPNPSTDSTTNVENYERNNFCADCHNANASWDIDPNDVREIKTSHVTGPAADGQLEVYGTTETVALTNAINTRGCRACHNVNDHGADLIGYPTGTTSAWPHQTLESKMLATTGVEGYQGEADNDLNRAGISTGEADTNRSLYAMDKICLACHSANQAGGGAWGVGNTF